MTTLFKILLCVSVIFTSQYALAQISTCAKKVKMAEKAFDEGRILEIESLLQGCLKIYNRKIKVRSYQLLFMGAVYTDNAKKTKKYLKQFKRLMPRYRPKQGEGETTFDHMYLEYQQVMTRRKD